MVIPLAVWPGKYLDGKKKPAKAASPNKTRATKKGAKGANKVAVVVHDEPEPAAVVIADPWLGLR